MNMQDLKIWLINTFSFGVTLTNIDITLKILLVIVTLGYTINKWYILRKNNKK